MFVRFKDLDRTRLDLGLDKTDLAQTIEKIAVLAAALIFYNDIDLEAIAWTYAMQQYNLYVTKQASEKYIAANLDASLAAMNGTDPLPPLSNWVVCYGPIYLGTFVTPAACDFTAHMKRVLNKLEALMKKTAKKFQSKPA